VRVGVYNRHWPTAGGGERFAGGIAEVLAEDHDVEIVGHEVLDTTGLAERLQLDLSGVGVRVVDPVREAVGAASADYDLFVNASYGGTEPSRAAHGLYVVHFPVRSPFALGRLRRRAAAVLAGAARLAHLDVDAPRWHSGVHDDEAAGPLALRWTDGAGRFELPAGAGSATVLLARTIPHRLGALDVEVRAEPSGDLIGRLTLRPWTSRRQVPVRLVRVRPGPGTGTLSIESPPFRPADLDGGGDVRRLGVPVLALAAGGPATTAVQLASQLLAPHGATTAFLDSYSAVAANSEFTRGWIRELWNRDASLLYPPVSAQPSGDKGPVIAAVGRFFAPGHGHSKRQVELVEAFGRLVGSGRAPGWRLVLAGGCDERGRAYLDEVRSAAASLPVELMVNATGAEVRELYARASLFWHLTGLGEDERTHPERFEHFGITTVEAMSAGAVPVVLGRAGQLELFESGRAGHHVVGADQLVERSAELIAQPATREAMAERARAAAERFLRPAFAASLRALVGEIMAGPPLRPS